MNGCSSDVSPHLFCYLECDSISIWNLVWKKAASQAIKEFKTILPKEIIMIYRNTMQKPEPWNFFRTTPPVSLYLSMISEVPVSIYLSIVRN